MDTARLSRELTGSIRLLWARERWLWSGLVAVLAGFALWVGATGAALNYGADFAGVTLSVTDWSSTTTAVFATVVVLWVLAPAAVVTYLVDDYITNVSGNVHTHYRVEHPFVLVAPFLVLFAAGLAGAVTLGEVPAALAGALVAVGLLTLVRTIAYSYRVFSFSVPALVHLGLFVSLAVTAVALLAGAGIVAGRRTFVDDAATGVGELLGAGSTADVITGTTTVGPVAVSTLLGLAATLPVGLAVAYLLVQSVVGFVKRARKPDVPRSQLRTGQRYPEFARPIAEKSAGSTPNRSPPDHSTGSADGGHTSAAAAAAGTDDSGGEEMAATDSTDGTDDPDDVSHTKVFTAPNDGDFDADIPDVGSVPDPDGPADPPDDEETAVVGSGSDHDDGTTDGYRCPTCTESFDSDTDFAYCPTCGTELEPE